MNETGSDQTIRYDSAQGGAGGNERHSLQTYVSDMLALENHIAQPVGRQASMDDAAKFTGALTVIEQIRAFTASHATALEQCLKQLGGHEASPLKSGWASLLGAGAAAIDSMRKTKVSKSLRDDYTALSLAVVSYTMLYTTAVGMGNTSVADLAKRHLADYARLVMAVTQVIPAVVLQELVDDGETVATGAAETIRNETNTIWKSQSDVTH